MLGFLPPRRKKCRIVQGRRRSCTVLHHFTHLRFTFHASPLAYVSRFTFHAVTLHLSLFTLHASLTPHHV